MKKIASTFTILLCLCLFYQVNILAQEKPTIKWIRVHSNNAEFSVEVPAKHNYFYDETGFWVSNSSNNYNLKKMNMLNAYLENTLLSFESYEVGKGGSEAAYRTDKWFSKYADDSDISSFDRNGTKIKQIITKNENSYCITQHFYSKSHVYILTAASKNGDNTTIKHFLDSLVFKPETKEKPALDSIPFSSLKIISVNLTEAKDSQVKDHGIKVDSTAANSKKNDPFNLIIVKKTSPSYLDLARKNSVTGTVELKLTFNENGFISTIGILKALPDGLLRQAIFAALRIKFLPKEENGIPVSTTKEVKYTFSIY